MMHRVPAIAAFANAALQLAVTVGVALGTNGEPEEMSGWRAAFMLYSWPVPLVTAIALLGFVTHPATAGRRASAWGAAALLGLSTMIFYTAAGIGLSALDGESRPEAFIAVLLSPLPGFFLAGLGATWIGYSVSSTPNWLVPLGILASVTGLASYAGYAFALIAMSALAIWWAFLGAQLSVYKPSQAATA
jgi:hypothetical protein